MFMSRHLEKTQKTKFRKNQREGLLEKDKQHSRGPKDTVTPRRGFDMWEDQIEETDDGC